MLLEEVSGQRKRAGVQRALGSRTSCGHSLPPRGEVRATSTQISLYDIPPHRLAVSLRAGSTRLPVFRSPSRHARQAIFPVRTSP